MSEIEQVHAPDYDQELGLAGLAFEMAEACRDENVPEYEPPEDVLNTFLTDMEAGRTSDALVDRIMARQLQEAFSRELARRAETFETDPRTGLLDVTAFRRELLRLSAAASRHEGNQFSLILMDLDGFKEINDEIGHAAGDYVLEQVAEVLKGRRLEDVAFRVGGDEFAILTQNSQPEEVISHIDSLRAQISKIEVGDRRVEFSAGPATSMHVTAGRVAGEDPIQPHEVARQVYAAADLILTSEGEQHRRERSIQLTGEVPRTLRRNRPRRLFGGDSGSAGKDDSAERPQG